MRAFSILALINSFVKKVALNTLFLITLVSPASAAVSDEQFNALKNDLLSLMARMANLEAENKLLKISSEKVEDQVNKIESVASPKNSWTDTLVLKGDLRYRYENIDAERSDTRERNRIRARVALTAKPADNLEVGIGLASGGADPVSTNQTLGSAGSTKGINLDLAYFKWQAAPGFNLIGGKMENIWYQPGGHGLIWDGDYRPEGFSLSYDKSSLFVNAGLHFLESDTRVGNTKIVYGLQSGLQSETSLGKLVVGVSIFDISSEGRPVFFGDDDDFFGNSFTCADPTNLSTCTYNNDFSEIEVFAQLDTWIGEMPLMLFADYIQNQDADRLDTGWASGFKLGKASAAKTWELSYAYENLEADAVFALHTDSDFGGGGTDVKGHLLKGAWAVNKKWKLSVSYFINERHVDVGVLEDYNHLQIDTAFKF